MVALGELEAEARYIATEYLAESRRQSECQRMSKHGLIAMPRCLTQIQEEYLRLAAKSGRFVSLASEDHAIELETKKPEEEFVDVETFLLRKQIDILEETIEKICNEAIKKDEPVEVLQAAEEETSAVEGLLPEYKAAIHELIEAISRQGTILPEDRSRLARDFSSGIVAKLYRTLPKERQLLDTWQLLGCFDAQGQPKEAMMRRFLERQFLDFVKKTVKETPHASVLHGIPRGEEHVRVFCLIKSHRMKQLEYSQDVPVWMLLFYLFRCGLLKEAAKYSGEASVVDKEILCFFHEYCCGRKLSIDAKRCLELEYGQRVLMSKQDPYKMALMKILGRCDSKRKTIDGIVDTLEDYLWLQSVLIDEEYSFGEMQSLIASFEPDEFNADRKPLNYFQTLVMCRMEGEAVLFLEKNSKYKMHLIMFSLVFLLGGCSDAALKERLQRTVFEGALSTVAQGEKDAIGLGLLLSFLQGKERLAAIVLRTKSPSLWFEAPNGAERRDSYISKSKAVFGLNALRVVEEIADECAKKREDEGDLEEALRLYNVARRYTKTLDVLSCFLSQAIREPFSEERFSAVHKMAVSIIEYYKGIGEIWKEEMAACSILISVYLFVRETHWKRWEDALVMAESTRLVPLSRKDVSECSDLLLLQPETVLHVVSKTAECVLACLAGWNHDIKLQLYGEKEATDKIRETLSSLVLFVPNAPRLSPDVFQRLGDLCAELEL
eukprot:GHVN01033807.1.p2 GENE.GHVN01033807.1~~GHVN01033807.1.p2  ORF type:complete len:722 (-),score=86.56 GHVN01033807.1:6752-8917(-)